MRRFVTIVLALIFLFALLSFTVTYSVRFTEAAVVTTFGKAGEGGVQTEPGLRFKWPYPIQSVTRYDTRVRLLTTRAEAQQTRDDRQIIVEAFLTWRVEDPLKFFERFSNAGPRSEDHYAAAERVLRSLLAGALAETGRYTLGDLFTATAGGSKLPELEQGMLAALSQLDERGKSLADYGIRSTGIGVHRVRLAEQTTAAVNDAIAANRDRKAKEIESAGQAEADAIRARAESDASRIREFARAYADRIRAEGDAAGRQYLEQMSENPELAIYIKNLDFIRQAFSKRTTVVLSTDMPGLNLLEPDALGIVPPGAIPGSGLPESWLLPARGSAPGRGSSKPGDSPNEPGETSAADGEDRP